jgi:hypothetical protein
MGRIYLNRSPSRGRTILLPKGGFFPNDFTARQRGTAEFEAWYSDVVNQNSYSTTTVVVDTHYTRPFVVGFPASIDRIAFEVTTGGGGGSVGRCGFWRSTSPRNLYPSSLVVDGGEFDCTTTGIKAATIDVGLVGDLYWSSVLAGVSAPVCRNAPIGAQGAMLGVPTGMGASQQNVLHPGRAYGALPSTYPAGAGLQAGTGRVVVHVRYSR